MRKNRRRSRAAAKKQEDDEKDNFIEESKGQVPQGPKEEPLVDDADNPNHKDGSPNSNGNNNSKISPKTENLDENNKESKDRQVIKDNDKKEGISAILPKPEQTAVDQTKAAATGSPGQTVATKTTNVPPLTSLRAIAHNPAEDIMIQELQSTGALKQVIGSQSVLSQELHNFKTTQTHSQLSRGKSQQVHSQQQQETESQKSLFDEDRCVRELEETGALQQVIGSQSVLSQELQNFRTTQVDTQTETQPKAEPKAEPEPEKQIEKEVATAVATATVTTKTEPSEAQPKAESDGKPELLEEKEGGTPPESTKPSDTPDLPVSSNPQDQPQDQQRYEMDVPSQSQKSLGEDDRRIWELQDTGQLQQVVGSQSLLSQEILNLSQRESSAPIMDTARVKEAARCMGLLSQDDDSNSVALAPTKESVSPSSKASDGATQSAIGMTTACASETTESEEEPLLQSQQSFQSPTYTQLEAALLSKPLSQGSQLDFLLDAAEIVERRELASKNRTRTRSKRCGRPRGRGRAAVTVTPVKENPGSDTEENTDDDMDVEVPQASTKRGRSGTRKQQQRRAETKGKGSRKTKGTKRKIGDTKDNTNANLREKKDTCNNADTIDGTDEKPTDPGTKETDLSPQKKRKLLKAAKNAEAQALAKQAADLAAKTIASPEVAKNLLLNLALIRINPRAAPTLWPKRGTVIQEGFFWGSYPPLEYVLREHMTEYYELSTTKCQSRDQQEFNNDLVIKIRAEAKKREWKFAPVFTDKILRDRIRCFFKTHIQNAKKRLRTMVKNPTKKANAKALVQHLDLIQKHSNNEGGTPGQVELAALVPSGVPAPRSTVPKSPTRKWTPAMKKAAAAGTEEEQSSAVVVLPTTVPKLSSKKSVASKLSKRKTAPPKLPTRKTAPKRTTPKSGPSTGVDGNTNESLMATTETASDTDENSNEMVPEPILSTDAESSNPVMKAACVTKD